MKRVCVVSGIAMNWPSVLMAKRATSCSRPELWEYPGGKVEHGETLEEALVRELREELKVEVVVRNYLSSCAFEVEIPVVVHLFEVQLLGPPTLGPMHSEIRWVNPLYAVEHMPLVPSAYLLYPDVLKHWSG